MTQTVLILGANGRFGHNAVEQFDTAGWHVRRFDRARDTLSDAIKGVDVVVNAWNPPDYSTWSRDLMPLHMSVIDALRGTDITVIVPGNVYVFGPQTPQPWSERSVHGATNPLGRLRIRMEAAYRSAGIRTIILRGGDFLDTQASGNWFDKIMVAKLTKGRLVCPGAPDIPHAWAYLPDIARAAVALAEMRMDLPVFADIPFAGFTLSGEQIADALAQVRGHAVRVRAMNWLPLRLLAPVWPALRGLIEMRYLWTTPHLMDDTLFKTLLPDFEPTPVQDALAAAASHVEGRKTAEPKSAVLDAFKA